MLKGHNIICFSSDWDQDPLSKHHIMSRLAKHNRILWINSIGMRTPSLSRKDLAKIGVKLKSFFQSVRRVRDNLYVVSLLAIPFYGNPVARALNRWFIYAQVRYYQNRLGLNDPILWTFMPHVVHLLGRFGEKLSLYYVTDDFSEFEGHAARHMRETEERMLAAADLTICVSERLLDRRKGKARHIYLMRHGVDYVHFAQSWQCAQPVPAEMAGLNHPLLGFWGELNESLDYKLLREVAETRPGWSIVLVGKPNAAGLKRMPEIDNVPNILLLGDKPFDELPRYAPLFDVALLPKNMSELSLNMNPLKLREYLAAGIPVVSAPLPEVLLYGDVVKFARTSDELIKAVEEILGDDRKKLAPLLSARVEGEGWDGKVEEISSLIEKALHDQTRRAMISPQMMSSVAAPSGVVPMLRPIFPEGKSFAFTIFDDTDQGTVENVKPVYQLLAELGMLTTKSVWVCPSEAKDNPFRESQTLADDDYLEFIRWLHGKGFEIAFHSASMGSSTRAKTLDMLAKFREVMGFYPKCHLNHDANKENLYWGEGRLDSPVLRLIMKLFRKESKSYGHVEGSPFFWGDAARQHITYVRNFIYPEINLLKVNPTLPYHDPRRPYVNHWFSSSEGSSVNSFRKLISHANQERLERENGVCIVYAHFAYGFAKDGVVDAETKDLLTELSRRNGWFVPVGTLLDYLKSRQEISLRSSYERARMEWAWFLSKLLHGANESEHYEEEYWKK